MPPESPAEIPEFLVERFTDYSPETLRAIGEYVRTDNRGAAEDIPDTTVESLALQSDSTLEAIERYVEGVATELEQHDAESVAALDDDDGRPWGHQQILDWHGG
ncbi:hypothetical protein D8Y22_02220 [Salinadaptatus halalkaliphilus]|uniref:Uncharacterized protein n=1 Tax=Salinadaptatus halalkaliphilus TaxID=2419781 RepID=A0A4S3TPY8_9EURY|nr:hypothetical protein [Salinadaptatus halalkaliphilus]THE66401.1 hypothetical protein D8Y22_02220 [Salinadaptatus halalkaliphilus]